MPESHLPPLPSRFRYRRNRIRNELMPYLREHFNPRADEALARTAEVLQDEVALLEAQAGQLLSSCIRDTCTSGGNSSSSSCSAGGSDIETAAGEGHHYAGVVVAAASGAGEAAVQRRTATPSATADSASCTSSSRITISVDREVMGAAPVALQRRAL